MTELNQLKLKTIWGNGAEIYEPLHTPTLFHGDLLVMGYNTYSVFTLDGYYREKVVFAAKQIQHFASTKQEIPAYCKRDVCIDIAASVQKLLDKGDKPVAILARGACITNGQHPDCGKRFIEVKAGMTVFIEGNAYVVWCAPNHNLRLEPIKTEG